MSCGCANLRDDIHEANLKIVMFWMAARARDLLFIDVVCRLAITVVIKVNFDKGLRVLTQLRQHAENNSLLFRGGRAHFQYGNEYFV